MMKNAFSLMLALCFVSSVSAQGLLGPRNLEVTEEGEFIAVKPKEKAEKPFDNFWAYRLYPSKDKKTLRGKGVNVAVLDSGIASNAEFNGKAVKLQDFTGSGSATDVKGHGTAIAGIIGAKGLQVTGLAPDAKLFIFKVDDGGPMVAPQPVTAALNAVLRYNEENPGDKISVVNLSYGVDAGFEPLSQAVRALYKNGVVIVAPAGNYGLPGVRYPASMGEVIAVSALAADGKSAYPSSSYGPQVEFIAPGDRVLAPAVDGNYTLLGGTSVAAGFVSAAAALAVEKYRAQNKAEPSVEDVRALLRSAAHKIDGIHDLKQGYGLIDVTRLESPSK